MVALPEDRLQKLEAIAARGVDWPPHRSSSGLTLWREMVRHSDSWLAIIVACKISHVSTTADLRKRR